MERFRELNRYQRILLLILAVMSVMSIPLYALTTSRVGYLHNDEIFVPRQENGVTIYEARIDSRDWAFTVTADTVTLSCGEKTYGPYTLREDPTAIPEEDDLASYMTGVELLDGEQLLFRGGIMENGDSFYLFHEDSSLDYAFIATYTDSNGIEYDMDGNPVDHMEPSTHQIISLLRGPELMHKGHWEIWFLGLLICVSTLVSILFADELFYLSICFRVENAENVQPSDWHIACRNLGWLILTVAAGGIYLMGLQA